MILLATGSLMVVCFGTGIRFSYLAMLYHISCIKQWTIQNIAQFLWHIMVVTPPKHCQTVVMINVGESIRIARVRAGLTQEQLARASKMTGNAIGEIERGLRQPRELSRESIAQALGFESWDSFMEAASSKSAGSTRITSQGSDIPVFDEVPAGSGDFDPTENGEDNGYAQKHIPRWMVDIDDPQAYAVIVKGNSMEPLYYSGDTVVCSPNAPHTSPMIAVFRLADGDCGIKQIEAVGEDELLLTPRNPNHGIRRVKRTDVLRLAQVVGHYRKRLIPM